MIYGAEVLDNMNCHFQIELKTKMGILKKLERLGIGKCEFVNSGYGWTIKPVNNNKFIIYCRSEGEERKYKKSSYSGLVDGGLTGSWEFWN